MLESEQKGCNHSFLVLWFSLLLAPVYMSGIWVGSRYFKGVSETVFRRVVVALVLIMGMFALLK